MGDAEVGHLDAPVGTEQHVLGGHVAMHDAALVGSLQGRKQLALDVAGRGRRERTGPLHELLDGLAGHVLHDDERRARRAAAVVDGHDVRMVQGGRRTRLAVEPGHELDVVGETLAQHLDRHEPLEGRVGRQVDLGHAAAAQPPLQAVAAGDQPPGDAGRAALCLGLRIIEGQTEHTSGREWVGAERRRPSRRAPRGRLAPLAV